MIHCLLLWFLLAGLNLLAVILSAVDKKRAKTPSGRRRRIPHQTFRLLSLFGGGPGLLVTLRTLRHKTRRHGFLAGIAALGLTGIAGWGLLLWKAGCLAT